MPDNGAQSTALAETAPIRLAAGVATRRKPLAFSSDIGRSGIKEYGGIVHEEYDVDLRGLNGIRIYDEMRRNDPTVAVGLRAIGWLLGQVNWSVEPAGETKEDEAACCFLDTCLHDMSHTWSKVIRDALTCLPFGWSWLEAVYKQRNGSEAKPSSRYDDGHIGWRKFVLIGQESWSRWEFDEGGGVKSLYQQSQAIGNVFHPEVQIPIEKSILFRLDDEKGNPEGISLLRPVFGPWYAKKQLQEVEAIGIERDLTGTLIINLPVGATSDDFSKARDLAEQFKADDMAAFIAPRFGPGAHEAWGFDIIASPGSKGIDPDKVIQRYQLEIARSFLAQFLLLGQGSTGSWALARDQRSIFEVALGAILMNFDETINRFMVPPLFRLNDFGKLSGLPRLKPGRVSKGEMDKFSKALATLAQAGLLTVNPDLERYIRDEMDLPELVEVESEEKPKEDTGDEEPKQQSEPTRLQGHAGHKGQHSPHVGLGAAGGMKSINGVKVSADAADMYRGVPEPLRQAAAGSGLKEVRVVNKSEMNQAVGVAMGPGEEIGGLYRSDTGTMYLLKNPKGASIESTLSHEMGHALDPLGANAKFAVSESPQWMEASGWKEKGKKLVRKDTIFDKPVSKYGGTSPSEDFAESFRVMTSGTKFDRRVMQGESEKRYNFMKGFLKKNGYDVD